jgi:hypothetical protein
VGAGVRGGYWSIVVIESAFPLWPEALATGTVCQDNDEVAAEDVLLKSS